MSVLSLAKKAAKQTLGQEFVDVVEYRRSLVRAWRNRRKIQIPTVTDGLQVLEDARFQASVAEIKLISQFDTARLANLWQLCRLSDPSGDVLEVGTYRGGTAIHLMNCRPAPATHFYLADTFDGFKRIELHPNDNRRIEPALFANVDTRETVQRLMAKGREITILSGVFPASDTTNAVRNVGFAHIDVVVYESCRNALAYLEPRSLPGVVVVVNDYLRSHAPGIAQAVLEFVRARPDWAALPLYPGQAVLFRRDQLPIA
jgi:hypothetical protein